MPSYQDVTNEEVIQKQVQKHIKDVEKTEETLQLIKNLCWHSDIHPDSMSYWLSLLNEHVRARKWQTSSDLIEIYPAGTTGLGRDDRLLFQVGKTEVAVVSAYESEH